MSLDFPETNVIAVFRAHWSSLLCYSSSSHASLEQACSCTSRCSGTQGSVYIFSEELHLPSQAGLLLRRDLGIFPLSDQV